MNERTAIWTLIREPSDVEAKIFEYLDFDIRIDEYYYKAYHVVDKDHPFREFSDSLKFGECLVTDDGIIAIVGLFKIGVAALVYPESIYMMILDREEGSISVHRIEKKAGLDDDQIFDGIRLKSKFIASSKDDPANDFFAILKEMSK